MLCENWKSETQQKLEIRERRENAMEEGRRSTEDEKTQKEEYSRVRLLHNAEEESEPDYLKGEEESESEKKEDAWTEEWWMLSMGVEKPATNQESCRYPGE
ncbi:hypothetical protein NDU88_003955 [Pleurodeles waltl]|uniref:Uncharacterized protein n=1 Tax=Pleurodeles waltl TaxID=8319 RepID=A0AAV7T858_PLEWA|nr:hypothetical protein NDU88_003955 [Pleurodeles waltl]